MKLATVWVAYFLGFCAGVLWGLTFDAELPSYLAVYALLSSFILTWILGIGALRGT